MPYLQTIPLSKKYKSEGTIQLHFNNKTDLSLAGYFTTTLYYRSKEPFTETDYYHGIRIYAELINSEPFFDDVGYIIYTDKSSYPKLVTHFGDHPKVILAVVNWPRFSIDKNTIDGTILRTLRYQAQDYFQDAWIAIRDADTLFAYEINNCLLMKKNKYSDPVPRPNAKELLVKLAAMIAYWEMRFIRRWLHAGDSIVIATNDNYVAKWHMHMPFTYAPKPLPDAGTPPKIRNQEYEDYLEVKRQSHIERLMMQRNRENPMYAIMKSQLGVYAGFTHISADAPKDIWSICCKYLSMYYSIIVDTELTKKRIISNTYSSIGSIGKDERMILFALMPKYIDEMYFIHMDYYGGLEIGEHIFGPSRSSAYALKSEKIQTSKETDIAPIETLLLAPYYVSRIYNLPYVYEAGKGHYELVTDGTMNEHFREIFKSMIQEYENFMKVIGEVGTLYLNAFGSRVMHDDKVVVPSLAEIAYKRIEPVRTRKIMRGPRPESASPVNRATTRRLEKLKALTKRKRRQSASAASASASAASAKNLTSESSS